MTSTPNINPRGFDLPPFGLATGDLAYLDTFSGLVPVKVTAIRGRRDIDVKVTATRKAYKRGEELTGLAAEYQVVPREAVRVKDHKYVISGRGVVVRMDEEAGAPSVAAPSVAATSEGGAR